MMRSMFSGVSGLRTHQTRMDIIGNNIANVNTVGFKGSRATFQEIFSQTLRGAGAPDPSGKGGVNPMQVGLGIGLASVDTLMTRGSVQRTDYPYDVAIDGDGYFIVQGGGGDGPKFTRAGNFGLDEEGNLVTSSGLYVQGWEDYTLKDGKYEFNTEKQIDKINFYSKLDNTSKRTCPAAVTTEVRIGGNLDASYKTYDLTDAAVATKLNDPSNSLTDDDEYFKVPATAYDALGNEYNMEVYFFKLDSSDAAADGTGGAEWHYTVVPEKGAKNFGTTPFTGTTWSGEIQFNTQGKIVADHSVALDDQTAPAPISITISPDAATGASEFTFNLDFNGLTCFANDSTAKTSYVDGHKSGNLYNFSIGTDGIITGMYDNGQQKPLGMIAVTTFDNPAGLEKVGENLFSTSANSGEFKKGMKPGTNSSGSLSPGTLEMSNVDLSKEFTEMIITQRGFQANSRIITASDEMLQELVNLKR